MDDMNEELQFMKKEIENFTHQFFGTAIGEYIFNWRANTRDDDYDGIKAIYDDLESQGYL